MRYIIDFMAIIGVVAISAGVLLQFSPGYALIILGTFMVKFALISAYVNRDNATDIEKE